MKNNYMLDAISVQAVHKIFCLFIFIEDFLLVETFDGLRKLLLEEHSIDKLNGREEG